MARRFERSLLSIVFVAVAASAGFAETPNAGSASAEPPGGAAPGAAPLAAPTDEGMPSVESPPPAARRVVLRGVKFGSDTAYIEPESAGVLELVAEYLRENPDLRVRISGYCDEQAPEAYNLELSQERAESVKRILVGFGVASNRLDAVGMGEADPIASNDTAEGRSLNRRVELTTIE